MTQQFIGQIQPFGFGFAPKGWAQCNGQTLNIAQNAALFSLLGTQYGGNGISTFALPNLQSRVPVHAGAFQGETFFQGETGGAETVTLTLNTMPQHNHAFFGTSVAGDRGAPAAGDALAKVGGPGNPYYAPDTAPQPLNPSSVGMAGGTQAHTNIQPFQAINWCIALTGIFPSRQ
jgi:microcystin-dependent protein